MDAAKIQDFIVRWKPSGGAERANYAVFLTELCDVVGVPRPDPSQQIEDENAYVFEKSVKFQHGDGTESTGRIDLYKRGSFVLETKQGVEKDDEGKPLSAAYKERQSRRKKGTAIRGTPAWDEAMLRAKGQAEQYARALPASEGRPPFVIVVDVGHSIELYSEFSQTGGAYVPFPDARSHRFRLTDLTQARVRETLRAVWMDPISLDPSRRSAKVTRGIADSLAKLAKSLEASGHKPDAVANFLMRCIFTMFAEDMEFLPKNGFTQLLESLRGNVSNFVPMIEELWGKMKAGGFSTALRDKVVRFNGALFEENEVLALTEDQFELLIEASKADWRDVEPAIFGTLLERALDPVERHKLGAHYTPRAYVERLVLPTVVDPIREDWSSIQTTAFTLANEGKEREAVKEVEDFHRQLCEYRILDPACGSGNFLYVTLEHLKRIEGEVLEALHDLKGFDSTQGLLDRTGLTVDPHQFLGIEINPRAAAIADLVLWIGYLQWHRRTYGKVVPQEPIIKNFHNIECRDAVLEWEAMEPLLDEKGEAVTRWDGRTMKLSPVTGKEIPDETARIPVHRFINPRKATWPEADFVVGNPPFIGDKEMRETIGDGYVTALRDAYKGEVGDSSDYVLYWWDRAAELLRGGHIKRFGFISTNSIRQSFNRRVLEKHLTHSNPVYLAFAIPDHPWVDSSDGAAVRIAMTVGTAQKPRGLLGRVDSESKTRETEPTISISNKSGIINADLTVGVDVTQAVPLKCSSNLHSNGVMKNGKGFLLTLEEADKLLPEWETRPDSPIKRYLNGRDLTQGARGALIIDLFGLEVEEVQSRFPEIYQWVLEHVKPVRDLNNRKSTRENWWIFGEPRKVLRKALVGLSRYIATPETAKHRFFIFLDSSIVPDHMLVAFALDDAFFLGVLSSRIHVCWALTAGGRLGVGNDPRYNKTRCFDPFPFPEASETLKARIRELGEALDAHRKRRQEMFPRLTMTGMYNVLEKLRAGESLSKKEKEIHEQGLVSVLKQIHDDLDAAVFEAYGWPATLTDEEILERLVALNAERAGEEKRGVVRWLRPDFQSRPRLETERAQDELIEGESVETPKQTEIKKSPWPKNLKEQFQAIRSALDSLGVPASPEEVARCFTRARADRIGELLETLASFGQVKELDDGRFVGPRR